MQHANVCECADIYSSLFAKNPTKSLLHVIPYLGILDGIWDCHNFLGFSKCVFGIAGAVAKMLSFGAFHPNWKSINFKLFWFEWRNTHGFFGIATAMSQAYKIDSAHHSYDRRVNLRSTYVEIILYTDIEEGSINGLVFLILFRRHYDVRSWTHRLC